MSVPGWYPDPGGQSDAYRYWDGNSWSPETTTDPRQPGPGTGGPGTGGPGTGGPGTGGSGSGGAGENRPGRSRAGYLIVAALVLVVVIVVAAVMIFRTSTAGSPFTDRNIPTSTVSGWDDSQPTDEPTSPTPSPGDSRPCPLGDPNRREAHPQDGRVHGGNLSFPAAGNFQPAAPEPRLSFAYDVTQQYLPVNSNPGWIAQLAVGRLLGSDFPGKPKAIVELIMQCGVTTDMYQPYAPNRKDLRNEAITISGQQGWLIEADIRVDKPGLPFPGDKVIFIVVPDGDNWGMFFGAVPIGNQDLTNQLNQIVRDLRTD